MANKARSIVNVDFQYAHRFMNWEGEAQYLHGHSGYLTLEIENEVDERSGFAHACKEAYKAAWAVADNFHHGTLFQEGDPLLEAVLSGYEKAGIRNGAKNCGVAKALDHPLVKSYPECRVSVTKKVSTCENFCEIFYELLKDKMNIKKITFRSSLLNCASREFN